MNYFHREIRFLQTFHRTSCKVSQEQTVQNSNQNAIFSDRNSYNKWIFMLLYRCIIKNNKILRKGLNFWKKHCQTLAQSYNVSNNHYATMFVSIQCLWVYSHTFSRQIHPQSLSRCLVCNVYFLATIHVDLIWNFYNNTDFLISMNI